MAQIRVYVPSYWPNFKVTSHIRETGSHASGSAVDIAIDSSMSRELGGAYWFYYLHTYFILWAAQRKGIVNFARPPECPHIHINDLVNENQTGIEDVRYINNDCTYIGLLAYYKKPAGFSAQIADLPGAWSYMNKVKAVAGPYVNSWRNYGRTLELDFSIKNKYITVSNNGKISESDLQKKLDSVFGDGSASQTILDNTAQVVGYMNGDKMTDAVKESLFSNPIFLTVSALAVASTAYAIAKEARYWAKR